MRGEVVARPAPDAPDVSVSVREVRPRDVRSCCAPARSTSCSPAPRRRADVDSAALRPTPADLSSRRAIASRARRLVALAAARRRAAADLEPARHPVHRPPREPRGRHRARVEPVQSRVTGGGVSWPRRDGRSRADARRLATGRRRGPGGSGRGHAPAARDLARGRPAARGPPNTRRSGYLVRSIEAHDAWGCRSSETRLRPVRYCARAGRDVASLPCSAKRFWPSSPSPSCPRRPRPTSRCPARPRAP